MKGPDRGRGMVLTEPVDGSWCVRGGVGRDPSGWRGQEGSRSCGQKVGDRGGCGGGIRERRVNLGLLFETWRQAGCER